MNAAADWRARYREKLTDAAGAVGLVRRGYAGLIARATGRRTGASGEH